MIGAEAMILYEEAQKTGHKFTPWETMFFASIEHQGALTPAQRNKVQEIYAKATGGGYVQRKIKI